MIVLDASVVVDVLTGAPGAALLRERIASEDLHAPHLLDHEVVSGLRGLILGRHVSAARATDALRDFEDLALTRWDCSAPLRMRALELRANLSAYDAAYVTLAELLDCPLVTRDARIRKTKSHSARVEVL